jgi:hypothetical protein
MSLQTFNISIDKKKAKPLKEFLTAVGIDIEESKETIDSRIERGTYKAGEKPSDFTGIWKENPKRLSANEIRKSAWQRKERN